MIGLEDEVDTILEYHFHVYWMWNDEATERAAHALIDGAKERGIGLPLRLNTKPVGPHQLGSCEVWVPIEWFAKAYSYFALRRPAGVSVLLHPLTRNEIIDHSHRAVWFGQPAPLKLSALKEKLDELPAQYPELGLGYSKKK